MKSLHRSFAAIAAVCLLSASALAADASGTWKWTQAARGGGGGGGAAPRETSLALTVKDGKVAGKITSPGRGDAAATVTDISAASVSGDTVSFSVERDFNGTKFVTKYSGKLAGDTITGESESPGRDGGAPMKREWVAKRAK